MEIPCLEQGSSTFTIALVEVMVVETHCNKFLLKFLTDTFTPAHTVPPAHLKDIVTTMRKIGELISQPKTLNRNV